jgi:hypothetical protein
MIDQRTESTLTARDVAELLGMSERTVRAKAQALGGRRPLNARAWRFERDTLVERARALGLNLPDELLDAAH